MFWKFAAKAIAAFVVGWVFMLIGGPGIGALAFLIVVVIFIHRSNEKEALRRPSMRSLD